jgi:hypothetical protein
MLDMVNTGPQRGNSREMGSECRVGRHRKLTAPQSQVSDLRKGREDIQITRRDEVQSDAGAVS